ncbi:MAG: hypothetical protein IKD76_04425 [Clostridia bacterium]|nr:hypothetical protein [Clostridia bacterium]
MLTTALVILLSYLLSKTSLRLTFELKEGCLLVFIIIVILLILSNIVKGILTPGKTLEEYKKDWDEPEICIARVVYITTVTALFTYLLYSVEKGCAISVKATLIWLLAIGALDIVKAIVIFYFYSFDVIESIKSSTYLNMRDVVKALHIILILMMCANYTTYGALLIITILGSIVGWILEKMQ